MQLNGFKSENRSHRHHTPCETIREVGPQHQHQPIAFQASKEVDGRLSGGLRDRQNTESRLSCIMIFLTFPRRLPRSPKKHGAGLDFYDQTVQ